MITSTSSWFDRPGGRRIKTDNINNMPTPVRDQKVPASERPINRTTNNGFMTPRQLGLIHTDQPQDGHPAQSLGSPWRHADDTSEVVYQSHGSTRNVPKVIDPLSGQGVNLSNITTLRSSASSNFVTGSPIARSGRQSTPLPTVPKKEHKSSSVVSGNIEQGDGASGPRFARPRGEFPGAKLNIRSESSDGELFPGISTVKTNRPVLVYPALGTTSAIESQSADLVNTARDGIVYPIPNLSAAEQPSDRSRTLRRHQGRGGGAQRG